MKLISVVIPAYNEGDFVKVAHKEVSTTLEKMLPDYKYEIIFVDDGSADDTFAYIQEICDKYPEVKAIKFISNCGAHMAIRAGLEHATGDMSVFIACDLQEPPQLIPTLIKELKHPYDIVLAVRQNRKDKLVDRVSSRLFFMLMRKFISNKLPNEGSSMYLMSSKVTKALRKVQEKNLTLESIFVLMNFKHIEVPYERNSRTSGNSKWSFAKKIKILIDFFVAYSYTPLRFVSGIGILFFLFGISWTIYIVCREIFVGDLSPGWPALISVLLIGFGITNISLGIISEYLWRTLDESRKRPKYIIEQKLNIE